MKTFKRAISYLLVMILTLAATITVVPKQAVRAETYTPVQLHGRLSVSGTKIVDQNGQPYQLRGISTHGINWDVGRPYVNQEAFRTLRDDWGANAVRLAMYTHEYNGYCAGGDQTALKQLVYDGVTYATNLGMYAVIDWHVLNDRNPNQYLEQSKQFFREVSAKYKNSNNVIYEICNEPNGGDVTWDVIKQYANTIIPIIRSNDPNAIIIVGTPTWSQLGMQGHTNEVADSPLTGYSNIVYSLHFYCAEYSHTQYLPTKVDYAVNKGLPILVSEFGLSEASGNGNINTAQADVWLNKLDSYQISYFCWSLSNKNESASLIASSCSKTSSWSVNELSAAGQYIRTRYQSKKEVLIDSASAEKIDAFVVRLYNKVLGREPDAHGRQTWNANLISRNKTGAEVAYGFVFSNEYLGRNTSNEDYIEMLYRVFLDRGSDAAGKSTWLAVLNDGMSREYVFKGFAESVEYSNICNSYGIIRGNVTLRQARDLKPNLTRYVNRLYRQLLGRNGDEHGLNTWCANIQQGKKTPEQVAISFLNSTEFKGKNLDNSDYIKTLYRTFLGREYDQQGYNNWMKKLSSGVSRDEIARQFAGSQEFKKIVSSFGL